MSKKQPTVEDILKLVNAGHELSYQLYSLRKHIWPAPDMRGHHPQETKAMQAEQNWADTYKEVMGLDLVKGPDEQ